MRDESQCVNQTGVREDTHKRARKEAADAAAKECGFTLALLWHWDLSTLSPFLFFILHTPLLSSPVS